MLRRTDRAAPRGRVGLADPDAKVRPALYLEVFVQLDALAAAIEAHDTRLPLGGMGAVADEGSLGLKLGGGSRLRDNNAGSENSGGGSDRESSGARALMENMIEIPGC